MVSVRKELVIVRYNLTQTDARAQRLQAIRLMGSWGRTVFQWKVTKP